MKWSNITESRGGSSELSDSIVNQTKENKKEDISIKMADNFEEWLCEVVQDYVHLHDVTTPGHRDMKEAVKCSRRHLKILKMMFVVKLCIGKIKRKLM